ncbi:hypothetical protein JL722_6207 [Aureococcus anophagefferens]|nr:hypothetical protein JL722_6207 [Aureococcus anophagefferens]
MAEAAVKRAARALLLAIAAHAGTEELICSDPRAVAGGFFLGQYVAANEATPSLTITANATQYRYGETVKIDIDAVGDRYKTGNWLAIQIDFTGPDGEAMGLAPDKSKSYADPYLYMKTVTLWDPTKWNPSKKAAAPPKPPGDARACVDDTPSLNGAKQGSKRKRYSQLQRLRSRPFSTRFG